MWPQAGVTSTPALDLCVTLGKLGPLLSSSPKWGDRLLARVVMKIKWDVTVAFPSVPGSFKNVPEKEN